MGYQILLYIALTLLLCHNVAASAIRAVNLELDDCLEVRSVLSDYYLTYNTCNNKRNAQKWTVIRRAIADANGYFVVQQIKWNQDDESNLCVFVESNGSVTLKLCDETTFQFRYYQPTDSIAPIFIVRRRNTLLDYAFVPNRSIISPRLTLTELTGEYYDNYFHFALDIYNVTIFQINNQVQVSWNLDTADVSHQVSIYRSTDELLDMKTSPTNTNQVTFEVSESWNEVGNIQPISIYAVIVNANDENFNAQSNPIEINMAVQPTQTPTSSPIAPTTSPIPLTPTRSPIPLTPTRSPIPLTPTRSPIPLTPTQSPVDSSATKPPTSSPAIDEMVPTSSPVNLTEPVFPFDTKSPTIETTPKDEDDVPIHIIMTAASLSLLSIGLVAVFVQRRKMNNAVAEEKTAAQLVLSGGNYSPKSDATVDKFVDVQQEHQKPMGFNTKRETVAYVEAQVQEALKKKKKKRSLQLDDVDAVL